ncbi:hypothetical protein DFA_07130 [Cavenderia fasciculata]|uniref:Peptidoglycan binding-like domain-containing protein n=1 Tax=Cavenderia fasciculata TaxID=261658 RepID=F4PVK0_CACFS|nr:uncharacterized protein DFA_07130 [Cavenderia fasciculata]EGG20014.1 hypothetical protein DFA_07130 [Cavenderia fasciculata]|eukprot:XP_004366997.1 hypothetical protein DFA_07130 [Cavenderia fasciculata]
MNDCDDDDDDDEIIINKDDKDDIFACIYPSTTSALYIEHIFEGVLAPQLQTIINFISGTIGQRPQFIKAGKLKFVFQYNDYINNNQKNSDLLWFVLVSDDDDSETLLRNRLTLLNHLYSMVLGNQLIDRKNGVKINMRVLKQKMSTISATVNALFDESQSVLCQAFEYLELNERIRTRVSHALTDLLNEYPQTSYAAIYIGQKLITFHCKQKPHLQNFDLFLLSIYCQIQLKPRERFTYKREEDEILEEQTTPASIAQEISSFENVSPRNLDEGNQSFNSPPTGGLGDDRSSGEDDMFETAPEDFEEPISFLASPFLSQLIDDTNNQNSDNIPTLSKSKRHKLSILMDSLKEGVKSSSPPEAISVLNYSLLFIGYMEDTLSKEMYTSNTEFAIKKFQLDNGFPETGIADFPTMKSILYKVKNSPVNILKKKERN